MLSVLTGVAASPGHCRVAVFLERGFPYFGTNELVSPRAIAESLHPLTVEAELVSAAELADPNAFSRDRFAVLVMVQGNTFPEAALANLIRFRQAGGAIVATGVPFTHPCVQEAVGGGRETVPRRMVWRDRGPQDHTGPDEMATGQVRFLQEPVQKFSVPPEDPLGLGNLWRKVPFPTASRTTAVFDPTTVGSRRWRPALLASGARDSGPVVVLIERGDVGPTALAGLGHCSDPREPAEVVLQQQLVLRGIGWCLAQMGQAVPDRFNVRCCQLAPPLPPQKPLPNPRTPPPLRLFPQPPEPAHRLTVLDVSKAGREQQILAVSMQGLVNRQQPCLYLIFDRYDREWLDWLHQKGLTGEPETLTDLREVVQRFRSSLRGAVVTPERWMSIAVMVAAARNLAILTPELAKEFGGRGMEDRRVDASYRLPVVMDLRRVGWKRDVEGYAWAQAKLGPRLNHRLLGHVSPHASPLSWDFLIAHRAFLFWIPGALDGSDAGADPLASLRFARRLFAETPPLIPVFGWWGWGDPYEGIGEYWGMTLASRYGKLTPGTEFASNLTVHSAIRVPESLLARRVSLRPGPELRPDRAYVALDVLDSGDAVWYCQRRQRDVWADPVRGTVPIGWSLTPSLLDFAPAIAAYFQQQATDHDELMAACSGLMYCSLREYGRAYQNPREVRRQYLETSWRYMQRLGLSTLIAYIDHWGAPTDWGGGGILSECAQAMPGLQALFPDLGRPDEVSPAHANYVLPEGVPVFHCLTRWRPWSLSADVAGRAASPEVAGLLQELREQVPSERPCFVSAFPLSWTMVPSAIREVEQSLPEDHQAVLPSELARLFMETRG